MCTVGVACNLTLGASAGILATKRKDVTTMATPIRAQIGDRLEAVRDPVVNLLFIIILERGMDITKQRAGKRVHIPRYLIWKYTL